MALQVTIKKQLGAFCLHADFSVETQRLALLGSSGAGKSLVLKCIAGIETPDEGSIVLDGRVLFDSQQKINLPPQQRRVGYLFQNYALFPTMTVLQNICAGMPGRAHGQKKALATHLVQQMRLDGMEARYPWQLSGGQQQRVALARLFASSPSVLLLDEPFSALDSYLRWQLGTELGDALDDFQGNIVLVTHSYKEAVQLCDLACVIEDGRTHSVRDIHALYSSPRSRAECTLAGCQNISSLTILDTGTAYAHDWGIALPLPESAAKSSSFVGIYAQNILLHPKEVPGSHPCKIQRTTNYLDRYLVSLLPLPAGKTALTALCTAETAASLSPQQTVFVTFQSPLFLSS